MERISAPLSKSRRRQRGIALIFCLFALILLSVIALGLISMSDTETVVNKNFRSTQQAIFGANAGIEEARSRLTPGMTGGIVPPTLLPGLGAGSVVYIINPTLKSGSLESIVPLDPANPWYDSELCHENYPSVIAAGMTNPGTNIPCAPVAPGTSGWWSYVDSAAPYTRTAIALNFKWVRINLKINATDAPFYVDGGGSSSTYGTSVCWDGAKEFLKPAGYTACDAPPVVGMPLYKPVYVITSLAQGSRRMTQIQVAQNPPLITNAAVDSQDHVTLNGQLGVNGYDYCSCMASTDGSGNTIYVSRPGKTCDTSKWGIYSASTVDNPNKSETVIAGQSPPIAQNKPWNYDIPGLISSYKSAPTTVDVRNAPYNWTTCTGTPLDCGTKSGQTFGVPPNFPPDPPDNPAGPANMAPQYTYVPGDLHITGNTQGNGVLIVDGDLDIDGGLQFYGLIIVSGVVKFTGGGSQKTNIYGAVLAGQKSIDDTVLGGSANLYYDYCSLVTTRPPQPPSIVSFRELMY
jgi:hypothetical protein